MRTSFLGRQKEWKKDWRVPELHALDLLERFNQMGGNDEKEKPLEESIVCFACVDTI